MILRQTIVLTNCDMPSFSPMENPTSYLGKLRYQPAALEADLMVDCLPQFNFITTFYHEATRSAFLSMHMVI